MLVFSSCAVQGAGPNRYGCIPSQLLKWGIPLTVTSPPRLSLRGDGAQPSEARLGAPGGMAAAVLARGSELETGGPKAEAAAAASSSANCGCRGGADAPGGAFSVTSSACTSAARDDVSRGALAGAGETSSSSIVVAAADSSLPAAAAAAEEGQRTPPDPPG